MQSFQATWNCDCVFDARELDDLVVQKAVLPVASLAVDAGLNVPGAVVGQTATAWEFYAPANAATYLTLAIVQAPVVLPQPAVYPYATGEAMVATRADYYADKLVFDPTLTQAQKDAAVRAMRDQNLVAIQRV